MKRYKRLIILILAMLCLVCVVTAAFLLTSLAGHKSASSAEATEEKRTLRQGPGNMELRALMNEDSYLYDELMPEITKYITDNGQPEETWSVTIIDTATDTVASWNNHSMISASIIKQFIMGTVFEEYDELCEEYGKEFIDENLHGMITYSDNDNANALINRLGRGDNEKGVEKVNAFLKKYGYTETRLDHPFYTEGDPKVNNMSSSLDNATLQWDILKGRFKHSADMLKLLRQQTCIWKLASGVPDVRTASKTGDLKHIENDCCIFFADNGTYIVSIQTEDVASNLRTWSMMQQIAAMAYDYFINLDRDKLGLKVHESPSPLSEAQQKEMDEARAENIAGRQDVWANSVQEYD